MHILRLVRRFFAVIVMAFRMDSRNGLGSETDGSGILFAFTFDGVIRRSWIVDGAAVGDFVGIEACDAQIEAWARSVTGDSISVSLVDPITIATPRAAAQPIVEIALIEMLPSPGADLPGRSLLRVALRYLVTVRADDVRAGHGLLSKLMFAAMEREGYEVEREVLWSALWLALGTNLRPSFLVRTEAQCQRVIRRRAKVPIQGIRVLEFVLPSPGSTFQGVVLRRAAGVAPKLAAGFVVECAEAGASCVTDAEGHFDLGVLPPWPPRKRIEVRAGDLAWQFEVDVSHASSVESSKGLTLEIEAG